MMVSPFTGGAVREVPDTQAYTFRGEQYEVTAPVYECVDTGEQFTTNEQDEEFLNCLHAMWRERHRVPTADALRARREELGLSAREMSDLLGLGVNQWRQYEGGEVPSNSNLLLLRMVCSRQGLAAIVAQQEQELPERTRRKLKKFLAATMAHIFLQPVSHDISHEQLTELLDRRGGALPLGAYMASNIAQHNSLAF